MNLADCVILDVDLDKGEYVDITTTCSNSIRLVNRIDHVEVNVLHEYDGGYHAQAHIRGNSVHVLNDKHLTEEVTRLQNLVNDFEAANIRRQGEIESLRKELEAVHKSYQEMLNAKKLHMTAMSTELQELRQSKRKDKIVDYSLVDPDLLHDYALAKLNSYNSFDDDPDAEVNAFEEEIEKQATFHPHVQQQIVKDEQGRKRFRKNLLVDTLVLEAGGHGLHGLNYVATLPASREDRAQLAQLIGYSVDGYQSLTYALPVEGEE